MKNSSGVGKYGLTGNSGLGALGMFHIGLPYDCNGKVFVEWKFRHKFLSGNTEEWEGWKRMALKRAIKEKRKIIKCNYCDKPVVRLDHLWDYHDELNACEDHLEAYKQKLNRKS